MSEKSFAITSIAAAVICGTFFYPPPPADASAAAAPARSVNAPAATPAKAALAQKVALFKLDDSARIASLTKK